MFRPWPLACLLLLCASPLPAQTLTAKLAAAVPKSAAQCDAAHLAALRTQTEELDRWAAGQAWQRMASGGGCRQSRRADRHDEGRGRPPSQECA